MKEFNAIRQLGSAWVRNEGSRTELCDILERTRAKYLAAARQLAHQLGREGKPVTVDDIRRRLPPPKDIDGRVMGAIFTRSEWVRLGYIPSRRRTCHGRPICEFIRLV